MWQLSISWRDEKAQILPVLRWSPTKWRKAEAMRDKIMRGAGTDEPWIVEERTREAGEFAISVHWRKPLSMAEVAQMADTPEVRERPGRA